MKSKNPRSHESQPRMERIMQLVAGWISLTEMKELQSACMLVSMRAREKEYEEFLSYEDGQLWNEMSEEWKQCLNERRKPSRVIKDVFNNATNHRGNSRDKVVEIQRSCGIVCRIM